MSTHFISAACRGEHCTMCQEDATHKVGEEFFFDDPNPHMGHNMTAYICCWHYGLLMKTVCKEEDLREETTWYVDDARRMFGVDS